MSSAASRQRTYRARRDRGRVVLRIEVDAVALGASLVEAGLIGEQGRRLSGKTRFERAIWTWTGGDA
jgi:hypothetical protein